MKITATSLGNYLHRTMNVQTVTLVRLPMDENNRTTENEAS